MYLSLSKSGGELNRYFECEKIKSLLFPALKITFQFLAQADIFSKSLFSTFAVRAGSISEANKQVSSANNKTSDYKSS